MPRIQGACEVQYGETPMALMLKKAITHWIQFVLTQDFPLRAGLISAALLSPDPIFEPVENGKRPKEQVVHPYL